MGRPLLLDSLFDWDAIQSDRDAAIEWVQQHHEILVREAGRDRRAAKKRLNHPHQLRPARLASVRSFRNGWRNGDGQGST